MLITVLTSTLFAKWHSMLIAAKLDTRSPPMVFFKYGMFLISSNKKTISLLMEDVTRIDAKICIAFQN